MVLPYGPPYPVSPLIRGFRWAFLIAGIFYGRVKQMINEAREENWREEEARKKIIRDKQIAIMKARVAREERETVKLLETGKLFELDEIEDEKPAGSNKSKKPSSSMACKNCGRCDECDCD